MPLLLRRALLVLACVAAVGPAVAQGPASLLEEPPADLVRAAYATPYGMAIANGFAVILRTSADPTMPRWPATHTRRPSSRNCEVGAIAGLLRLAPCQIGIDHLGDQPGKVRPVLPAELLVRLRGIAEKEVDFGRTEVTWVDGDENGA